MFRVHLTGDLLVGASIVSEMLLDYPVKGAWNRFDHNDLQWACEGPTLRGSAKLYLYGRMLTSADRCIIWIFDAGAGLSANFPLCLRISAAAITQTGKEHTGRCDEAEEG